jgi:hypothetical protein
MTVFELEDALVEFIAHTTDDYRLPSNEQTLELTSPAVWSGFIPRDEVGSIVAGDITVYPAIIVNAQSATVDKDCEVVMIHIVVGCFDANLDQQGYRDCCNIVQRIKDRLIEESIIRERFPLRMPMNWQLNKRYGGAGMNSYPYFFGELQASFELPIMSPQFDVGIWDGDVTPGRYNSTPIPTPPPLQHSEHPTPPPIKWEEHHLPSI